MDKVYAVDRIEDNIVVLEEILTKEKIEVSKKDLPKDIKDGTILKCIDDEYILDKEIELERRKRIEDKFKRLRNGN